MIPDEFFAVAEQEVLAAVHMAEGCSFPLVIGYGPEGICYAQVFDMHSLRATAKQLVADKQLAAILLAYAAGAPPHLVVSRVTASGTSTASWPMLKSPARGFFFGDRVARSDIEFHSVFS